MLRHAKLAAALSVGLLFAQPSSATLILIEPDAGLSANAGALAVFNRAAARWGSMFSDPITVTINASYVDMGVGAPALATANSVMLHGTYDVVRNRMVADAADEASNAVVAALPTFAQFAVSNDNVGLITDSIRATKANLKAMGFTGLDASYGASDATVSFNSRYAFDFDRSDGIAAGTYDFENLVMHEIGHVLGFTSSIGISAIVMMAPMDLFRFGDDATPGSLAEFTTAKRNFGTGSPAYFDDLTDRWALSTGAKGDGQNTSHWKDDALTGEHIGIMDPTLYTATSFQIEYPDLRVLDLIGWDLVQVSDVPEPGSLALVALGLAGLVASRRRQRPERSGLMS